MACWGYGRLPLFVSAVKEELGRLGPLLSPHQVDTIRTLEVIIAANCSSLEEGSIRFDCGHRGGGAYGCTYALMEKFPFQHMNPEDWTTSRI